MKNYECFDSEAERKDIVKIGENLAKYLFKKKINNIIFIDRAARPGYIALIKSWNKIFPNTPRPNIYFTNPDGYTDFRTEKKIAQEFNNTYKNLSANKDAKILIFDVCMHTGETIEPLLTFLKKEGYKNVFLGLSQPKDDDCDIKNNFSALKYEPSNCCYPFDRDRLIERNLNSVLSERNYDRRERRDSILLRKEISSLF